MILDATDINGIGDAENRGVGRRRRDDYLVARRERYILARRVRPDVRIGPHNGAGSRQTEDARIDRRIYENKLAALRFRERPAGISS